MLVYGRVVTEIYRDALSNLVLEYGRVVTEIYVPIYVIFSLKIFRVGYYRSEKG